MKKLTVGAFVLLAGFSAQTLAESLDYSIARGGRLYDKWFAEKQMDGPKIANPAYPASGKYKGKKSSDWRCKECHGWDYLGAAGAYSSGKHHTGIKGVRAAEKMNKYGIENALRDSNHGYTQAMLSDRDVVDLMRFLQQGQMEMQKWIDPKTKLVKNGDAGKGQAYYETICATCHGLDGKTNDEIPPLGKLSNKNPWETLHKILNGQPDSEMPALRALDLQVSLDILSHLQQNLPKE